VKNQNNKEIFGNTGLNAGVVWARRYLRKTRETQFFA